MKHWWKIAIGLAVIVGGIWLVRVVTTPPPGVQMADVGRDHVTPEAVAQYQYNSNPPTSGPHLATWVKSGVYDKPQSEGELIHSLEHGYIIISYNCNIHLKATSDTLRKDSGQARQAISKIYAHEEGEGSSPSGQASASANLELPSEVPLRQGFEGQATGSATNETNGCKSLVKELTELANRKRLWKLIIVPRPQLDTTIALTAWGYIDKFDAFDAKRIERFIDYHRDHGPEKTME